MAPSIRDFFDNVPEDERPQVGDAETSANFDMEDVQPFLEHLHAFSIPLGRLDVIAEIMADLPVGRTHAFEAIGVLDNQMALVTIEAFIDDVDAPDIRFIGPKPIIDFIDKLLVDRD
ncbi:MAG: hypothetical protein KJP02_10190 [Octadecabacter sp.]|nr:hypothetical protein [Octadecabacter sp.]